ncbi:glutaredoxin domain-containing protein [Conexibacter stalactiti]|uniref:Glutaredoxin domain-containing protein n=1 Tax=Conexibacter stalactiti TaxID=1940611 RepID=A0ABU4HMW2_9ACTN|nr:glutaredoxin domain-containing protein [Conexibacter stalactiti]MDW5594647.1 glutaredoxin domain-containing protein [Conexibacter stalactiti]MEC5035289.1 glutaredoxin domain-containing protein [Conexibacter stalactiti]
MAKIMLYTTDFCPYCVRAKALLEKRALEFEEINLARDPDGRAKLVELTGMMTFPQILIDGETLGGYDQLAAADKSGKLAELLAVQRPA